MSQPFLETLRCGRRHLGARISSSTTTGTHIIGQSRTMFCIRDYQQTSWKRRQFCCKACLTNSTATTSLHKTGLRRSLRWAQRQSTVVYPRAQQHYGVASFRIIRCLSSSSSLPPDDDRNDPNSATWSASVNVSSKDNSDTTRNPQSPEVSPPHLPPLLRVAVLGPPNAGKSTLFNRLMDKYENRAYKLQIEKGRPKKGAGGGKRARSSRTKRRGNMAAASGGALVSAIPGTTRDRRQAIGSIGDIKFLLYDTAGVDGIRLEAWYKGKRKNSNKQKGHPDNDNVEEDDMANDYQRPMMEQAVLAAQDSSIIFFVFDGRVGLTADDLETCRWLRRHVLHHTRVVMLANKLEGTVLDDNILYEEFLDEASRAGFGPAIPISALQGDGIAEVAAVLFETQKELGLVRDPEEYTDDESDDEGQDETNKKDNSPEPPRPLQMAILGRPNVGKSTLVNALLQEHRVITGSRPGLTRDAIRVPWTWNGHAVQIVDTAGIRKASQRKDTSNSQQNKARKYWSEPLLEDMAVQDAIRALQVADVAVLVIDAEERNLTKQDMAIADLILQEGRVLVLVVNKMDLIIDEDDPDDPYTRQDLSAGVRSQLEGRFPFLRKTPIIPLNSKTGKGVASDLMPVVLQARERWERKISTGKLNRWLAEVVQDHAPPAVNGRTTKLKYMLQTKGRPPTFLLYTNRTSLAESYLRYLTRQFQESFDMYGMQVRLAIKKSTSSDGTNPFAPTRSQRGGFGLGGRDARQKRRTQKLKDQRRKAQRKQNNRINIMSSWRRNTRHNADARVE